VVLNRICQPQFSTALISMYDGILFLGLELYCPPAIMFRPAGSRRAIVDVFTVTLRMMAL